MLKYIMDSTTGYVYKRTGAEQYDPLPEDVPVIIVNAADWERLVDALREDDLEPSVHDTVWEIIAKVKEANNG